MPSNRIEAAAEVESSEDSFVELPALDQSDVTAAHFDENRSGCAAYIHIGGCSLRDSSCVCLEGFVERVARES